MKKLSPNFLPRYILFCLISIFLNLLTQEFFLIFFNSYVISILFGTVIGFLIKFYLDKNFIFLKSSSFSFNQLFTYTFTAIFSTIIFWSVEIFFLIYFQNNMMKILGGFLGLILGYTLKFKLDYKLTFNG